MVIIVEYEAWQNNAVAIARLGRKTVLTAQLTAGNFPLLPCAPHHCLPLSSFTRSEIPFGL